MTDPEKKRRFAYRVLVEFKRIQTYVFAVPRMRTILGANALIGETLRIGLARAAVAAGCTLPDGLQAADFCAHQRGDTGDPLSAGQISRQGAQPDWLRDDPAAGYRHGVLTRDGGHFRALFADESKAAEFAAAAQRLTARVLPGLLTDIRVEQWAQGQGGVPESGCWVKARADGELGDAIALYEPPGTDMCQWSGNTPATRTIRDGSEQRRVCKQVQGQWYAGRRFSRGRTSDVVGLLQRARSRGADTLLPCFGGEWCEPRDLQQVAGGPGRYLAVIHIDGNGVGKRTPKVALRHASLQHWLDAEAKVEAFFHSMRVAVRAATVEALNETFHLLTPSTTGGIRPYQMLMLGGDDLLLVMAAEHALPFVVNQARALRSRRLADESPLDIGAGVVIARPAFPFHRLHALAEELASSAKRLARGKGGCGRSVVDWMVVTQSAVRGIAVHRQASELVRYKVSGSKEALLMTAKPYFVLRSSSNPEVAPADTLEGLLELAQMLRDGRNRAARSQRKSLPDLMRTGRKAGELAMQDWLDDLPVSFGNELKKRGINSAWHDLGEVGGHSNWITRAVDLTELAEIPDLGRRRSGSGPRREHR